ncbi:aminopeptidase P family protein [Pseudarthrobacter sp. NamE5]|uniref:aminopeptidase P family protein n=1 Tax=Pseudarthrobacter sp. NamE5 TaxID=2576839 RepID=UPI00110C08C5|nr:aminopeptidase P family protein [Pseudarthrobacter sp. NamE5]TLM80759.1 aminopeptidase P family protein [Pseudarthrobacter sp. NamE5]
MLTGEQVPYQSRWRAVWESLESAGLDALVIHGRGQVAHYGNIAHLTGHIPSNKGLFAVVTRDRAPEVVAASAQAARYVLLDASLAPGVVVRAPANGPAAALYKEIAAATGPGTVGLAASDENGLAYNDHSGILAALEPGSKVIDAASILESLRRQPETVKTEHLRRSMARAEGAMEAAAHQLRSNGTEAEVAGAIAQYLRSHGSLFDIIHVAANGFHGQHPGDRPILDGDLVTVFIETSAADGHWVELGALFAVGGVSTRRLKLADQAMKTLDGAATYLRTGHQAGAVAEFVARQGRRTIGIGHCTGLDEIPLPITDGSAWTLLDGEAIALHPSLVSEDGQDAIGIANTYIVGETGGIPLSQYPKTLRRISRSHQ